MPFYFNVIPPSQNLQCPTKCMYLIENQHHIFFLKESKISLSFAYGSMNIKEQMGWWQVQYPISVRCVDVRYNIPSVSDVLLGGTISLQCQMCWLEIQYPISVRCVVGRYNIPSVSDGLVRGTISHQCQMCWLEIQYPISVRCSISTKEVPTFMRGRDGRIFTKKDQLWFLYM